MDFASVHAPHMNWDSSNLPDAWKKFRQHAELMFSGPLNEKSEEEKCSYLLIWVGEKGRDIHNTWTDVTDENRKKLKTYYVKFEEYVTPKANPVCARYKFHNKVQGQQEPVEQFVTELKLLAKDCSFKDPEEMIRDRIVFGTNSFRVREKLISVGADLTLDQAVDISRTYELSQSQLKAMKSLNYEDVHGVGKHNNKYKRKVNYSKPQMQTGKNVLSSNSSKSGKCGLQHQKHEVCKAKGQKCHKCLKYNHFARQCRTGKVATVEIADAPSETESDNEFYIYAVSSSNRAQSFPEQVFVEVKVGPKQVPVKCKLDTGAGVNVLPPKYFDKLGTKLMLIKTAVKLYSYSGERLNTKGKAVLKCTYKNTIRLSEFYVVQTDSPSVLSLRGCLDLKLIELIYSVDNETEASYVKNSVNASDNTKGTDQSIDSMLQEYADVFKGIGQFPGEHTIRLTDNTEPKVYPPRRVPIAMQEKFKAELKRMQDLDVIVPVDEPTEFVNPIVIVEKPNTRKLRICLDPKNLNQHIRREHYPIPTLDDAIAKIGNSKFYSKLDLTSGYWQVKLDYESSLLTTFNTPFGRYRFTRMPFGIKSAEEVFQKKFDEVCENLEGCFKIVDDVIISGKSKQEHDHNLMAFLQRCREKNIRINREKCVFFTTQVSYFGDIFTSEGLKPDPTKLATITQMEPPNNKAELATILGMVNYLSRFAPNLAAITAPMRDLMKKDSEFVWDAQQDCAFKQMKEVITSVDTLAYFDPSKEVTLQVDSSKKGLGAVMFQDGKPVAFASKALNACEQRYAQIEKELYAILFGCERFHHYVYGRAINVESDHKPLESVMKKPLCSAPPRLQRMLLRLQKYDMLVMYKPGKSIPVADALSRKYLNETDNTSELMEAHVHLIVCSLPISDQKLKTSKMQQRQIFSLNYSRKPFWMDGQI